MVVKLSKIFGYALFFLLALMYFMPKSNIYYFLEHELDNYGVVINNEEVIDSGFSLNVLKADINVKSISSATIGSTNIKIFGVYNNISLEDIKLASVAASMVPTNVKRVDINYNIFNPFEVTANALGAFGEADVSFDLLEMSIHLKLNPSKKMLSSYSGTLRNLKKTKEGVYVYDKIIKH